MHLILSAQHLASIGGAETYLVTVAEQLERIGHGVVLYAEEVGEAAEEARARGLRVADRVDRLPAECDAILVQDTVTSHILAERYPETPQVFVSHGIVFDWTLPPQLPGLVSKVIVMNDRVGARAAAGGAPYDIVRLRQPIDLDRFSPRGSAPDHPRRLLMVGNYLRGSRRNALLEACASAGIEARQLGAHGDAATRTPELEVGEADIVVGYGRSAIEGMASGTAVYVYDHSGGDGWVTAETYPELEANGFAGSANEAVIDGARLRRDLAAYEPDMGLVNRELARKHHDATRHAADLVDVLRAGRPPEIPPDAPLHELARLTRIQWQVEGRAALLRVENDMLRERVEVLEHERQMSQAETNAANEQLANFKATRRYRAGAALAAPVDRLRDSLVRAPRPRLRGALRRRPARILGLVAFRNEERFLPGLLENLETQVDGLVALDDGSVDGSAELVREHPLTLKVISVSPGPRTSSWTA